MFIGVRLLKSFLGKICVNIVVYMINMSPMSTINCKTHMKVWKERLEDYENLRVFGTKMKVGVQEE